MDARGRDIVSGPPLLQALEFPGRRDSRLLASGFGRRCSWPTFPLKCSQGGHSSLLAAQTKMFLLVLNSLYPSSFETFSFNQGF